MTSVTFTNLTPDEDQMDVSSLEITFTILSGSVKVNFYGRTKFTTLSYLTGIVNGNENAILDLSYFDIDRYIYRQGDNVVFALDDNVEASTYVKVPYVACEQAFIQFKNFLLKLENELRNEEKELPNENVLRNENELVLQNENSSENDSYYDF